MNPEIQGIFEKFLQQRYPQELQKIQGQTQQAYQQLGQQRPQTFKDKINPFLQAGMSIAGGFDERGKVAPMQQQMRQDYQDYDARQTANYQNPLLMQLKSLESQRAGLNDEYAIKKDLYGIGQDQYNRARTEKADNQSELNRMTNALIQGEGLVRDRETFKQKTEKHNLDKEYQKSRIKATNALANFRDNKGNNLDGGLTPNQLYNAANDWAGMKTSSFLDKLKAELMRRDPVKYAEYNIDVVSNPESLLPYFENQDLGFTHEKKSNFGFDALAKDTPYPPFDYETLVKNASYYRNLPTSEAMNAMPQLGGQQMGQPPAPQLGGQPASNVTEVDIDNMTEEELIRFLNGQ